MAAKAVEFAKSVHSERDRVMTVRGLNKWSIKHEVIRTGGEDSLIVVHAPTRGLARWTKRHRSLLSQLNFPRFRVKEEEGESCSS